MKWLQFTDWFPKQEADFQLWKKHFAERGIKTKVRRKKFKNRTVYLALFRAAQNKTLD